MGTIKALWGALKEKKRPHELQIDLNFQCFRCQKRPGKFIINEEKYRFVIRRRYCEPCTADYLYRLLIDTEKI